MLDASGPKQKKLIVEYDQDDDYKDFDEGETNFNIDNTYSVKPSGEKFMLGITKTNRER